MDRLYGSLAAEALGRLLPFYDGQWQCSHSASSQLSLFAVFVGFCMQYAVHASSFGLRLLHTLNVHYSVRWTCGIIRAALQQVVVTQEFQMERCEKSWPWKFFFLFYLGCWVHMPAWRFALCIFAAGFAPPVHLPSAISLGSIREPKTVSWA